MRTRRLAAFVVMGCLCVGAQASDSMRCGSRVIDSEVTVEELVAKCGEPTSKRVEEADIRVRTAAGGYVKRGTTITEYWTYDRGSRGIAMLVTITDGKIRSIDRAE